MQIIPRYLVKNRIDIVADLAGLITEYRPVYTRQLEVYKGIDNVIQFRLLNSDQKPVSLDSYTIKFLAFDENKNLVIEHFGTILQEGDSSAVTNKGIFTVTVTENDLLNIKQQYLSYVVYLIDSNDVSVLTYSTAYFQNAGVIKINSTAFPGPKESKTVSTFTQVDDNLFTSEGIDAEPGINGNNALHTVAVYTDNYIGDFTVQATLDNQINESTNWADITTVNFLGTETEPTPINFFGVFTNIRFASTTNPANKITKILVRN